MTLIPRATRRRDFNDAEVDDSPPRPRRTGQLIIHGLTGRANGQHWFVFQVGDGPRRVVADMDVSRAVKPSFDLSPVMLAGEVLWAEDVVDMYQYAIRALTTGDLICHHHTDVRLAADESCSACITEQTENDA